MARSVRQIHAFLFVLVVVACGETSNGPPEPPPPSPPPPAGPADERAGEARDASAPTSGRDRDADAADPSCAGCRDDECCKDGMCWPGLDDAACGANGRACATCGPSTGCRDDASSVLACVPVAPDGADCTDWRQCKGRTCEAGKCAGAACTPAGGSCSTSFARCCSGLTCDGASGGGLGACCHPLGSTFDLPEGQRPASSSCCAPGSPVRKNGAGPWTCL